MVCEGILFENCMPLLACCFNTIGEFKTMFFGKFDWS